MIAYVAVLAYAVFAYVAALTAAVIAGSAKGALLVALSAGLAYLFQSMELERTTEKLGGLQLVMMVGSWAMLGAAMIVIAVEV